MKQLLLATRNRHKFRELKSLLTGIPVTLISLDQFPHVGETVEDQNTLEGNALKKAREAFRLTRLPSLADDTGLEVHYLNEEPGVFSSRYAGAKASYADNCKKLLEKMRGVPPRRRAARFRCVVAIVGSDFEETAEGICRGTIIEHPRGTKGFGYDPLFVPAGHTKTFAEMSDDLKNTLSHRFQAIQNIRPILLSR
jgi:XTP/dITP diphosphohydrolase